MRSKLVLIAIFWLAAAGLLLSAAIAQESPSLIQAPSNLQTPSGLQAQSQAGAADSVLPPEVREAYRSMQGAVPSNVQVPDSVMRPQAEEAGDPSEVGDPSEAGDRGAAGDEATEETDEIGDVVDAGERGAREVRGGERPLVYLLVVDGAIGAVTTDRVEEAVQMAEEDNAELLVIMLDTPGGFTQSTWSISKAIMNSRVPVAVYIAPRGARAGSAGVYITYASHVAAMAPSTNIGAAHPVAGGGQEMDSVMSEKITNDAVAQIKATAKERGRNVEWAEQAVRQSVSIDDREAVELNVVDLRANDVDDLLEKINGRVIEMPYETDTLFLTDAEVEEIEVGFVYTILQIITDPNVALILFSLGSLGLVIELYNPGAILPGVVGAICLILSLYAFQTLDVNYAGLALIILAIILFILEIKVVSYGVLTLGGLISFFFGGLMLYDTVDPNLQISLSLLITITILVAATVLVVGFLVYKSQRRQAFSGEEGMVGKTAVVRANGMVYIDGALWRAEADEELKVGDKVTVVRADGLTLRVKKQEGQR